MKQTFLVFPGGLTGTALLLLRVSVAISLATSPYGSIPPHSARTIGLDLLALALAIGLFTRVMAVVSIVFVIGIVIVDANLPAASLIGFLLTSLALAMIGPGAASIDARLFGRRKISLTR